MAIEKFIPKSPDRFIRNSQDFEVARFGHLNELVGCINATGASGIAGAVQFSNGSGLASNAENLFWNNTTCSLNATKLSVTSLTCGQAVCAGVSGQLQTYTPASGAFQSINSNTNIIPLSSWSNSIPLGSPSSTYNTILGGCLNLICTNSDPGYFVPLDSSSILGGSNNILLSGKGSSIVTGCSNLISSAYFATVSGGRSNSACYANYGFIGGGRSNCIRYNTWGTISGGYLNKICSLSGSAIEASFIGSGINNNIKCGSESVIVGGGGNTIFLSSTLRGAFIGTGSGNYISGSSSNSSITSGCGNSIANGNCSSILGGFSNRLSSTSCCPALSIISGGSCNTIDAWTGNFIGGGNCNRIACNTRDGVIVGGYCNSLTPGCLSFIGGGSNNNISNLLNGFIGGGQGNYLYFGANYGFIGGGCANSIECFSGGSNILGGSFNRIMYCSAYASVLGGSSNCTNSSRYSTIAGGNGNLIISCVTGSSYVLSNTIAGGVLNKICKSSYNAIHSGICNSITATNTCSTIVICAGIVEYLGCNLNGILGGQRNLIADKRETFIVGSCITADRDCATFVNNLSITNIPTSSAGLPAGSVWNDGGFLKIV